MTYGIVWQLDMNGRWMIENGFTLSVPTLGMVAEEWLNGREWEMGTGDWNVMRYYPSTFRMVASATDSGADAAMDMFTSVMFGEGWDE